MSLNNKEDEVKKKNVAGGTKSVACTYAEPLFYVPNRDKRHSLFYFLPPDLHLNERRVQQKEKIESE